MRLAPLLLLTLTCVSTARPTPRKQQWYPVEQTISRADAPVEDAPNSVFGTTVALSDRWLAISETNWDSSGGSSAAVHLFQRAAGKGARPWRWKQQVESDAVSVLSSGSSAEFPLALNDRELVVAAPWPEGLAIYLPDRSGQWIETQTIREAFGGTVWPKGKIQVSDDLVAFPNVGGSLFVFARNPATGEWQPDREFPKGAVRNPNEFFLDGSRLALLRRGDFDQPIHVEFHERTPEGTWLEEETVELFEPGPFLQFAFNIHAAFDGDDLLVVLGHTDFLGNPAGGSTLWRISEEAGEWSVVDEVVMPYQSSRVAANDGCILVHGFTPDILGNPLWSQPAMLDRGFQRHGDLPPPVGTASLNGARFATSGTRVDFLGNVADQQITIFRNPWAGWFRRR
jgi:hypothetical protein